MGPEIKIVPFDEHYLDEIMAIEEVSFTTPWSRQCYLDLALMETVSFFVAKREGEVVGYMLYQGWSDELELHTIAVAPHERRQGIGQMLLEYLLNDAAGRGVKQVFLQVRPSNTAARALYQKFGFAVAGVRPKYYRDNHEDALIMNRCL